MTSPGIDRVIATTSRVVAAKDQVSSDLGGETILLSMQTAMYYGLEGVAARVWELLRTPARVGDICDVIESEYDVEPARCQADVLALLREMSAKGLIEVDDGAGAGP